jgi:hypothetical protein
MWNRSIINQSPKKWCLIWRVSDRASLWKLKNKNQLDATYYFIVLLIGSTCFGHCYAHHRELTTIVLITTRAVGYSIQPGHLPSLPTSNFEPTATQEPDGPFGNQYYSRELLMMGIAVPETCWAYHKYNKIISSIYLVLIVQRVAKFNP